MAKRKEPATAPLERQWRGKWEAISRELEAELYTRLVDQGMEPRKAVREAFGKLNVESQVQEEILDEVVQAISVGKNGTLTLAIATKAQVGAVKKWWLHHHWSGDNLSLSKRIAKNRMRAIVVSEVKQGIKNGDAWTTLARNINQKDLVQGDVAGHIWDLINAGKRALQDPKAASEVAKALRKSQARIEQLAKDGAPTEYLKKAYSNVVKVAEKGSAQALEKAIERAVRNKARYNAERIARTEKARAYSEGFHVQLAQDDDAIGWRSELSSRHPVPDICDFHAGADLYGAGPGVYPIGRGPEYPYHPHCTCQKTIIYGDDKILQSAYDSDGGKRFIQQNKSIQRNLLGVGGAEEFGRDKGGWERNLKNWNGHTRLGPELPEKFWGLK